MTPSTSSPVTSTLRQRFGPAPMAVALILAIVAVGTAGYMVLEGASFMDALYMTAITISTVGYGETVLAAGDTLVVLDSSKGLADLAPELSPA